MDSAQLFCRLMAEATAALEDAAGLAAELQSAKLLKSTRTRRLAELEALTRDSMAVIAKARGLLEPKPRSS